MLASLVLAAACAAQTHVVGRDADGGALVCDPTPQPASPLPVDLFLVVDASAAMAIGTVWADLRAGVVAFAAAPTTTTPRLLGLALHPAQLPCTADADCGAAAAPGTCAGAGACVGDQIGGALALCPVTPPSSPPAGAACTAPTTCRPRGVCTLSHLPCLQGLTCPGGLAGDACAPQAFCPATAPSACDPRSAQQIDVPPGPATAVALGFDIAMQLRAPQGSAALGPALAAAYAATQDRLRADPSRRAAVVVLGDADSFAASACPGSAGVSPDGLARAALQASPAINTHVIALARPSAPAEPQTLASAGGGRVIEIASVDRVAHDLGPALVQIEAAARACDLVLPPPLAATPTAALSLALAGAGQPQPLTAVADETQCASAADGGWYLRAGNDAGTADAGAPSPRLASLCPDSCARFRADPASRITLAQVCPRQD